MYITDFLLLLLIILTTVRHYIGMDYSRKLQSSRVNPDINLNSNPNPFHKALKSPHSTAPCFKPTLLATGLQSTKTTNQDSGILVVLHRSRSSEYNKDLKQYTTTPNLCRQQRR